MKGNGMLRTKPEYVSGNVIATLKNCRGYYECPRASGVKGMTGRRFGPLVGYAGTYDTPAGPKVYVGNVYYNVAKAEEWPHILWNWARDLDSIADFTVTSRPTVLLGAPMGGILLAGSLARSFEVRCIFAEKKVVTVGEGDQRERSRLVFNRHEVLNDDQVWIVEDVCNNFSTTDELCRLVAEAGGKVVGIFCIINRSSTKEYRFGDLKIPIPVVSLLHTPTEEWRQDDPEVETDVSADNVVWKPKERVNWAKLTEYMQ
jgi:adenine/guanine phosphoribosyltransferase-like PRPP-binding protein